MQYKQGKPTISQVAKLADVSKTTVSRYLNGRYEFMSELTRKRIQEVVEELEYRPNNLARSLKSNHSGLIGVVVADISSPFSSILVKGIGDQCTKSGYHTIIANTDNDPVREKEYIEALIDNRVEGLILNITGGNNDFILELGGQGIPIVLADRAMLEIHFDTVTSNNYQMTYQTIEYLVRSGFREIGFFTEEIGVISSRRTRRQAFLDACEHHFRRNSEDWIRIVNPADQGDVQTSLLDFLAIGEGPRAVFAVNGVTMLSVAQAITSLSLAMPRDLGLCGYDDWGWASLVPPGITVISQPSYQVGIESAKRLIGRIQQKRNAKPKRIELPSSLVIRGSTRL